LTLTVALFLVGCSTTRVTTPTGGSRADGTVDLTYEYGGLENAQVDWSSAQSQAEEKCHGWGYAGAERFGGEKRTCMMAGGYGCNMWQATITYQCTGGGVPPLSTGPQPVTPRP
jgi:hypothetical protein